MITYQVKQISNTRLALVAGGESVLPENLRIVVTDTSLESLGSRARRVLKEISPEAKLELNKSLFDARSRFIER
ncbi:MAG: hypothetical protein UR39_C0007G0029 [Candidatus Woesebacteria bacterium GW2011_GWA1_33_30]|uniref:Uncharacterized protein n=1 Tax=Candidatus Woesebacteria bacterium GW2011_GWA2_33_28 TaxID=1618561 RepID=A0A0G0A6F6_9BACT|nr:MAG: hypothetical protein UR38_C0007G0029 [Candidatus Woesebacteria bacterium GW2011_GWA2_33_28]KKP47811.1 MAG: hypothetical protein UR39_C0007G0029 [Candidatus Woesebacteria bacterium GW2011_GWA1_33_30]KKP49256.1 MAG: hypothetical protein UR40_C0008G0029 [Microgenomates group bacterium GW2011_GWC1_33_32]KKP51623.1 MAG: hypothetical protein UR44_C0008G0025 [Candidatus Woesebacteria bacterium GW2011_GWB1_33_38]KKP57644.1 MAG: hypothetical protein UR48_C0013G0019 [Microgenomates group bacteriu